MRATSLKSTILTRTVAAPASSAPAPEPLTVLAARLAITLETSVTRCLAAADQNLGHLETQALHDVQALLREATRRAAQAKADATPPRCPVCGQPLRPCAAAPPATRAPSRPALATSPFNAPAATANAAASGAPWPTPPWTSTTPPATPPPCPPWPRWPPAKCHGQRAQHRRTQLDEPAATEKLQLELPLEPYQLMIQLDTWPIRERDDWSHTTRLRRQDTEPERWHWVYCADRGIGYE